MYIFFHIQVVEQIQRVDREVQVLFDNLQVAGILGCVDVIVLSDHGMAPAPEGEKFLIMENYIPDIVSSSRIYDGVLPQIRPYLDTEGMLLLTYSHISCMVLRHFSLLEIVSKEYRSFYKADIIYHLLNSHQFQSVIVFSTSLVTYDKN